MKILDIVTISKVKRNWIQGKSTFEFCFLILMGLFIAGCATTSSTVTQKKIQKPIFYPSAPDAPRIQFLTSFSSSDDFEEAPSAFRKFVVGQENKAKPIVKPYGIRVHNNKIYICDTVNNGIDILDFNTRKFEYFRPKDDAQLIDPINLDFDEQGNMYVADARRGQVLIFDQGEKVTGFIGKSSEFKPTDVKILNDKIYLCDIKSHSVKVFGLKDRKLLFSIPRKDAKEEAKLFSPTNLASDAQGNIYVSDTGAFRIQKYNSDGEYLATIGSHGDAFGQFARPKGVAIDPDGKIYVVDAAFENVQIFDEKGKLLLFFPEGGAKSAVSLILPSGIAIDSTLKGYFGPLISPNFEVEYLVLVASQYGENKLSVFGYGHKK